MIFIFGILGIVITGLVHPLAVGVPQLGQRTAATHGLEAVGVLLVLRAFAAGCSALTGVEAIANGVPLFREPRQVRAKRTEAMLGIILGAMLLGLAVLALRFHNRAPAAMPDAPWARSWAIRRSARYFVFYLVSLAITAALALALALAANTSFGGSAGVGQPPGRRITTCPISSSLPSTTVRCTATGSWFLALFSRRPPRGGERFDTTPDPLVRHGGLHRLHTLCQIGLVVHWWRTRAPRWQQRAASFLRGHWSPCYPRSSSSSPVPASGGGLSSWRWWSSSR